MPAMIEAFSRLRRTWHSTLRPMFNAQTGAVAVYVGLTIPLFVGAGGLAVDVTGWYRAKRNIQSAADAAAYAAALNLAQQGLAQAPDQAALQAAANDAAARNGVSAPVTLSFVDARSIEVIATEPAPLFFTSAFLDSAPAITARSVARAVVSDACIWSLHPSARAAFEIAGSASVNLACGVVVNSTDPEAALEQTGSSCLSATSVSVRGDYAGNCVTPQPEVFTPDYGDPLSHLQPPAYGSCDFPNKVTVDAAYANQQGGGPVSLPNGVYCGGLEIKANQTVIFQPGLYVLKGGQFYIAGNAHVSNTEDSSGGVTFYLTGTGGNYATLRFESGADITLTPMTVPPLENVLFYQDPNAPANGSNRVAGGATMDLTGILYFPNQHLEFTGGSSMDEAEVLIVSSTITFTGNTYLNADYASGLLPEQYYVRLVE
jgi:Flp pilus assembly protein TadG